MQSSAIRPSNSPESGLQSAFETIVADYGVADESLAPGNLVGKLTFIGETALQKEHYDATHDELTGLPNRRALNEDAENRMQHSKAFALGLLDVNRFKLLNDTLGHEEGDRFLKQIASVNTRGGDVLYRLGGDEFIFLVDMDGNSRRATDIGDAMKQQTVHFDQAFASMMEKEKPAVRELKVGVSIGWSYFDPSNPRGLSELKSEADTNMYAAKQVASVLEESSGDR